MTKITTTHKRTSSDGQQNKRKGNLQALIYIPPWIYTTHLGIIILNSFETIPKSSSHICCFAWMLHSLWSTPPKRKKRDPIIEQWNVWMNEKGRPYNIGEIQLKSMVPLIQTMLSEWRNSRKDQETASKHSGEAPRLSS